MDPGIPDVRRLMIRTVIDVVHRYDIDGVHIDDYFYPYPETDAAKQRIEFPDAGTYAAYQKQLDTQSSAQHGGEEGHAMTNRAFLETPKKVRECSRAYVTPAIAYSHVGKRDCGLRSSRALA